MAWSNLLGLVALMASSCGALIFRTEVPCNVTGVNIDDEVFSRLIAKLPEGREYGPPGYQRGYRTVRPGLEVGGATVHGLSKLRRFGPAIPYCAKGRRMVQADFISFGDARFTWPWKTCWGNEGNVTIRAELTRYTFQFRIAESAAPDVKLEFDYARPATTQDVRVEVEGVGREVQGVFEILRVLFRNSLKDFWLSTFSRNLNTGFYFADS
ncbi:hypothetical protein MTO96_026308 [Rhipicephalus appendiculatus]